VISPLALEAVRRIDAIFAIEREINGHSAAERLAVRQARIVPLIAELEAWMRAERVRLSRHAETARRSTTCSSAGRPSPAFSMTGASVCRTMPPSEHYAVLPWGENHGCSRVPIAADSGPRRSIA
jgi:hypothetical protein